MSHSSLRAHWDTMVHMPATQHPVVDEVGQTARHLDTFTCVVAGRPAPQGSKDFKGLSKAGRGILVESSKLVLPWRDAVKAAAILSAKEHRPRGFAPLFDAGVGVVLSVRFHFIRPKSHYGTGRNAARLRDSAPDEHVQTPDLSKLIRSTEDALVDARVMHDDSQVVRFGDGTGKFWSRDFEGATITVTRTDAEEASR